MDSLKQNLVTPQMVMIALKILKINIRGEACHLLQFSILWLIVL